MMTGTGLTIAFRVDASLAIGTGHVMRCLTLAKALRAHGNICHFICREHKGHLLELIRQHGFGYSALPALESALVPQESTTEPSHAQWLGCGWSTDASETDAILAVLQPEWLVVDHYALDARWERALHKRYKKLLVIDDLADRYHACDVLLDQNLGRKQADYATLVPDYCATLAGPQYALLRPEFSTLREYSLQRRTAPALKQLLITMGGVDQLNATGKVLEALKGAPLPSDCRITVVMGVKAPWLEQVRSLAATLPWHTEVCVNVSNMAQIMADSDLAMGAAGSSSWERCCLGLPSVIVVIANNQRLIASALHSAGAAYNAGDPFANQFLRKLHDVLSDYQGCTDVLKKMSACAASVTDGQGVSHVLANIKQSS